uniref:Rhamnogalacturonan lyase domain-containing protein n=1 Tax=Oryza glumipatula TaxID=40148 RepID=A0A0E0ATT7_9ORYZ
MAISDDIEAVLLVNPKEPQFKGEPYSFPESPDFHKVGQRGSVTGRLFVRYRYMIRQDMAAGLAYVGLASPGQPGSWATESKNYQFWTRATPCGSFSIGNVGAGVYNLLNYLAVYP